jgi:hypothetical protein
MGGGGSMLQAIISLRNNKRNRIDKLKLWKTRPTKRLSLWITFKRHQNYWNPFE